MHKLLERQISKHLNQIPDNPEISVFLKAISDSYDHFESDRLMLERSIEISSEEMIQLYNTLRLESSKLKLLNSELTKTNSNLDKFVYCVSHDLRAPLSSMLGMVQLSEDETEDPNMIETLSYLKSSINKLDTFIQDILNYSRNSRMEIKKSEINFEEMLTDIATNHKFMNGANQNVQFTYNIEQKAPYYSDKTRLNIVLSNLISNAIRYYNPQAESPFVNVDVNVDANAVNIIVSDNGIGIKKELQDKVFDMFYRVSESSAGTGLGLYIVKEAIEKIGGNILIDSEPQVGTQFKISFSNN